MSKNWFTDPELQLFVNTFEVPNNFYVAQFGSFDYLMHSGTSLNENTFDDRMTFFDGGADIRHLLFPVGFTYSGSNLNKNLKKPATSDHTALLYFDQLMEKMVYFDANNNKRQKDIVEKNLKSYIVNNLEVDDPQYEVCQLPTLKDGCGLVTAYAIEQIVNQKSVSAEFLTEKGYYILNGIKRRIEAANGYRTARK